MFHLHAEQISPSKAASSNHKAVEANHLLHGLPNWINSYRWYVDHVAPIHLPDGKVASTG